EPRRLEVLLKVGSIVSPASDTVKHHLEAGDGRALVPQHGLRLALINVVGASYGAHPIAHLELRLVGLRAVRCGAGWFGDGFEIVPIKPPTVTDVVTDADGHFSIIVINRNDLVFASFDDVDLVARCTNPHS